MQVLLESGNLGKLSEKLNPKTEQAACESRGGIALFSERYFDFDRPSWQGRDCHRSSRRVMCRLDPLPINCALRSGRRLDDDLARRRNRVVKRGNKLRQPRERPFI